MFTSPCRVPFAAAALAILIGQVPAFGQIAPPRTLEELKAETQARADRNGYPLTGLKPDDVREALSNIRSLDRDEWATATWRAPSRKKHRIPRRHRPPISKPGATMPSRAGRPRTRRVRKRRRARQ